MPYADLPELQTQCMRSSDAAIGVIVWNIAVVLCCFILAFLTRRLPQNYNESKFITFCAICSLVVFIAFSFTSVNESIVPEPDHRAGFSAVELNVNATTTLCCLFIVKLYAVYFVKLEKWNISKPVSMIFRRPPAVVQERKDVTSVSSLSDKLESGRSGIAKATCLNDDDGVQLPDDGGMKPASRKEEEEVIQISQPPFLEDGQQDIVDNNNEDGLLTITPVGNDETGVSGNGQQMK